MTRFILPLFIGLAFTFSLNAQTFEKNFNNELPDLRDWISNDKSNWTIINSSVVAGGATDSKTLKLNAKSGTTQSYLSIQNNQNWGSEQTWSFWIGRDQMPATTTNNIKIWLWANNANLLDPNIEGYRISFGDNTGLGDDVILQRVIKGESTDIINAQDIVLNNLTRFGVGIVVTRSRNGQWTIYTSDTITASGRGVKANEEITSKAIYNRNKGQIPVVDNTYTPATGGYLGIVANYTTTAEARKAVEFDQLKLIPAISSVKYEWQGDISGNGLFSQKENWRPVRDVVRVTDILEINKSGTIEIEDSVVAEAVLVKGTANVTFGSLNKVRIALLGQTASAFEIEEFSRLNFFGDSSLLYLPKGARGEINGSLQIGEQGGKLLQLVVEDEKALIVHGVINQDCEGNLFGTTGSKNNVVFQNGSQFVSKKGANPFGLTAPSSKVIFEKGSKYVHMQNLPFATSGRSYSDFELKGNATISLDNQNIEVDNFLISDGRLTISNNAANFKLTVMESLKITGNSSFALNGNSTIELRGENTRVFGADKITFGVNSSFITSGNIFINDPITIKGTLVLKTGVFNLNGNTLSIDEGSTIQKINGSFSSSPEIKSPIKYLYGDGTGFEVIETGNELQENVISLRVNNPSGVKLNKAIRISESLALEKGNIISDNLSFITLGHASNVTSLSNDNFVIGPLAKEINSAMEFQFPVGINSTKRPLSIITSSSDPITFKVSYFNNPPQFIDSEAADIKWISNVEYWNIEKSGTGKARVKLNWNENSGINQNIIPNMRVARFDGEVWANEGRAAIEGETIVSEELTEGGLITFGAIDESIVPVEFLSFEGINKQGIVELIWYTASELNNEGFEVEKSLDGILFQNIGFVAPSSDKSGVRRYTFADEGFLETSYYRLKQLDINGNFEYSNIIIVKSSYASFMVSPNPSNSRVKVSSPVTEKNTIIRLAISNLHGTILAEYNGSLELIDRELNTFLAGAGDGLYFLYFQKNHQIEVVKFVKG